MRGHLVRAMLIWAVLSAFGVVIVAIPDSSAQVITLSDTHGPAAADLLGIALLLLGWVLFLVDLWRARRAIRLPPLRTALTVVAAAGVVTWSVLTDAGLWWVLGAAALCGIQIWAGVSATVTPARAERKDGDRIS